MQQLWSGLLRILLAPALVAAGIAAAQPPVQVLVASNPTPQRQVSDANSASLNWAGYVAQRSGIYTDVSGRWVVPTVSPDPGTADATWVGIGGVTSGDLLQAGTQAVIGGRGNIDYEAWYEALPGYSVTVPLAVNPGDVVTVSLKEAYSDVWHITIVDNTTGQSYSRFVTYSSSRSSAEWIEEMVSNGDYTFRPLDRFGAVSFIAGSTTLDGVVESIAQSGARPLLMINGEGETLAAPSRLASNGEGFAVVRGPAVSETVSVFSQN